MSHKFLPFITEASSPESIFKALVQRSKGFNLKSLSAIYSAILSVGIKKVKDYIKTLPVEMSSNDVMNSIAANYVKFATPVEKIDFWKYIIRLYGENNLKTSTYYSLDELSIMVSSIATYSPDLINTINFSWDTKLIIDFSSTDFDRKISYFNPITFDTEGTRIGFVDFLEFKAYMFYLLYVYTPSETKIFPVHVEVKNETDIALTYKKLNCLSPYYHHTPKTDQSSDTSKGEIDDIPF